MAKLETWEKWAIGGVVTLTIGGIAYMLYKKGQSSTSTAPTVCTGMQPSPQTTPQGLDSYMCQAQPPTTTQNTPPKGHSVHVVCTILHLTKPAPLSELSRLAIKSSTANAQTQNTAAGGQSAVCRISKPLPLAQQDIAIGTALLFNFLLVHGNLSNAQSLQSQYWDAINANDATQMMNVYFACVDELKAQWYNKQPSQTPQYLDHAKNAFNVLYAAAKIPGIVGSGTGNAVYYANSLISFVIDSDNGKRWTM